VRHGAGRMAECHLRRSGRGGGQPAAGTSPAELSRLLTAPRGAYPAELLGGVPVIRRRRGQVGQDVRRTVRCRSLSTIGCPPGPVSGRLAPSSRIDLSGRLVSARPAVSCLVSARTSCGVRPVPGQPAVALGARRSGRGLRGRSGSGSVWPTACPSGSVYGWRPGRRRRCGGRGPTGRGGCRSRTWAGLRSGCGGGRARPLTDQGGQPSLAWGRSSPAAPGRGARLLSVVVSSLTPQWTRPEGQ
jgi:hypothetical protein